MKAYLIPLILLTGTAGFAQMEHINYCERESAGKANEKELKPFRYSGAKAKRITLKEYNQIEETVVEMLYDIPYKIVFNRSGIPDGQEVHIYVYDKPYGKKSREVIWKNTEKTDVVVLETESLDDEYSELYIEYELPAYQNEIPERVKITGCVVMTIGYNNMKLHSER